MKIIRFIAPYVLLFLFFMLAGMIQGLDVFSFFIGCIALPILHFLKDFFSEEEEVYELLKEIDDINNTKEYVVSEFDIDYHKLSDIHYITEVDSPDKYSNSCSGKCDKCTCNDDGE